ncbi:GDSL-type esterase/lipase family protein [Parvibaculum sp.]|uniref:GDSL-type esterase/lipase family protein n=1 Tax=Parvibaculum sp. TaxID=2024848 RepID=UPI001D3764D8|nr:GDSL-type esterase/lipase family protein [Parvibaculum sp.]MBX3489134.1 hypothetical protein [Parvibaculum sp.]MCW5726993.1 hypothetical protein [Parvibaculum sp.]
MTGAGPARSTDTSRARARAARFAAAILLALCIAPAHAGDCPPPPPGLQSFHAAIDAVDAGTRSYPITVLHLGDSHISLDHLTRPMRARWQARFGDAGRGLMPGVPFRYYAPDGFALSMRGPWVVVSSLLRTTEGPFGIQGFRASADGHDAVMTMTADAPFSALTLEVAGGPDTGAVMLKLGDAAPFRLSTRRAAPGLVRLTLPAAANRAALWPAGNGPVHLLGWSIAHAAPDGHAGIRYDSHGIVAATATITERWDKEIVDAQLAALTPDLVILGYGTNEGFDNGLDLDAHKALLGGLIDRIRAAAPGASLALLGPFDGARQGTGEACGDGWATPPKLGPLRETMRALAAEDGAFYWDGEAAMGGRCSVHRWAMETPPLAYTDRVHLRPDGAARLSEALWAALMGARETAKGGICRP